MKQYFLNIWYSLMGGDPRQWEISRMRKEYESVTEQVKELERLYAQVSNGVDRAEHDSQALIETLRQRVKELKSELNSQAKEYQDEIERLKKHYQERIDQYTKKIEELTQGGQEEQ